jgi:hypothetical protein
LIADHRDTPLIGLPALRDAKNRRSWKRFNPAGGEALMGVSGNDMGSSDRNSEGEAE